MADYEDLKQLIENLQNTQIAPKSETYRKLQENLKTLNEKIAPLMMPGPDGWELLTDEKRGELLTGYTEIGTAIQEYLREVAALGPNHPDAEVHANVAQMVGALAGFVREDAAMLRQYDPVEDPKSLPTLFEEARTVTLEPNNRELSTVGAAMSTRIPMTINLNGQKMEGVFTQKQTYDPAATFNKIIDNAIRLIPPGNREEGAQILKGLLTSNRSFQNPGSSVYEGEQNTPKGKTLAFMNQILHKDENGAYGIEPDKLLKAIKTLTPGTSTRGLYNTLGPNAVDYLCDGLVNADIIMNGAAGIPEHADIGIRNVAMYRTAQLFGIPEVVCRAVPMKIKIGDQVVEGTFMQKADGIDAKNPVVTDNAVDRRPLDGYDPEGLRKAADLQILDFITGNIDRHGANMFYQVNLQGKFCGVQGIDNDMSFGLFIPDKKSQGHLLPPHKLRLISKEMADKINNISDDQLRMTLHGLIEPNCIEAAIKRLHMVQNQMGKVNALEANNQKKSTNNLITPVEKGKWGSPEVLKLLNKHKDGVFGKIIYNMPRIAAMQHPALKNHPKFGTEVGNRNRATEGGAFAQYDKAHLMAGMMKRVTNWRGSSPNFENMRQAVEEYKEFQANLIMRMKQAKQNVKNGSLDEEDIANQRISYKDLEMMKDKLQKIKDTAGIYKNEKLASIGGDIRRAKPYQRRRMETADLIFKFADESLQLTNEEQKTVGSNQRRTMEELVRANKSRQQAQAGQQEAGQQAESAPQA